jgi:hypothetical protein
MMMLVPLLLFTAIALSFYGALVKLAARILHFTVTWKACFLFAFMMLVVVLLSRAVFPPSDALARVAGHMLIMAVAFTALGSWFFRTRIADAQGRYLGWSGSIRLSALALSLIFGFGLVVFIAARTFVSHSGVQP